MTGETKGAAPRRGRPPAAPDAYKGKLLSVRFTGEERAILDAAAAKDGLDLSAWARRTLLDAARALPSPR